MTSSDSLQLWVRLTLALQIKVGDPIMDYNQPEWGFQTTPAAIRLEGSSCGGGCQSISNETQSNGRSRRGYLRNHGCLRLSSDLGDEVASVSISSIGIRQERANRSEQVSRAKWAANPFASSCLQKRQVCWKLFNLKRSISINQPGGCGLKIERNVLCDQFCALQID